ncbi:MAG: hypothetical protein KIS85_00140 [Anaerolineales bacterium]|nr:hypothetical protein [Anaerolineales bacterium]
MKNETINALLAGVLALPLTAEQPYLDPGSGSFILQIIIASLAAVSYAFRQQLGRLVKFFRRSKDDKEQ